MLHAGLGYLRIVRTEWGDVIVRTMLARGTFHSVGFYEKGNLSILNVFSVFSEGPSKWKTLATKIKEDGCTACNHCFLAPRNFEGCFEHY